MDKPHILEACVDSAESAFIAVQAGANRLELCANLMIGGTTPTLPLFRAIRRQNDCRIHVLIRPRFGDFCYSEQEFDIIREEVKQFRKEGADGVVIGVLSEDGSLDTQRMEQLMRESAGMSVTLHRAFDVCRKPFEALEAAKELGIRTILTSGQKNSCVEGIALLRALVQHANGHIDILAGSGIDSTVIPLIYRKTGITSYHMSGKRVIDSRMKYRQEDVHMGLSAFSEYEIWQTDADKIKAAAESLNQCLGISR